MLKIGDAAKRFDVSNRTLRYWEEKGILKSTRAENGYRYYDEENALRIKQIYLLRQLEMPLAKIEGIFIADDFTATMNIFSEHLENLKRKTLVDSSLAMLTENLINQMKTEKNLDEALMSLETSNKSAILEHEDALQILLSERNSPMNSKINGKLENVRIVKLPSMTVAACRAESATPEEDCAKIFNKFVLENNLHKRSGYRQFGFNNPSSTEGNPIYGYEMWVSIPEDFEVPAPLERKQFSGGLYASISTYMNEIGARWQELYNWSISNEKYEPDFDFQWLEECSMDFETFISKEVDDSEKQLDLLEPIKER